MIELLICKAEPTVDPIEDVTIRIARKVPEFSSLASGDAFYETQAHVLAKALGEALPQGLYHRLLIHMLQHQVSYYVGPSLSVLRQLPADQVGPCEMCGQRLPLNLYKVKPNPHTVAALCVGCGKVNGSSR